MAVIAAIAGYSLYTSLNKEVKVSDLTLANVEALANTESGIELQCWQTVSSSGANKLTHVTYCGTCTAVLANAWSSQWQCR